MKSAAIFGSINLDITSYLERRPDPGETVFARNISLNLGGKGANQSVALRRLGVAAHMIGAIGNDVFGVDAKAALSAAGVTLYLDMPAAVTTGLAVIDVADDGSNDIRIASGANGTLTPKTARQNASIISDAGVLLLQNEVPLEASLEAARIARENDTLIIMDPAPAPREKWSQEVMAAFDLVTPNAHEVETIIGWVPENLLDAEQAAREICAAGCPGAIVTAGELGIAWNIKGESGHRNAPEVEVIDTVAAGDCFNAGLAAALVRGADDRSAITFACHVGSLATTRSGASVSAPSLAEVLSFIDTSCDPDVSALVHQFFDIDS